MKRPALILAVAAIGMTALAAAGLQQNVFAGEDGVAQSQTSPDKATKKAVFPKEWFFYGDNPAKWAQTEPKLKKLVGKPAPELTVSRWQGGENTIESLKGQIILIDFWGTWCPPCRAAIPHTSKMAEEYAEQGVKIVGVHSQNQHEKMESAAKQLKVGFPTAADVTGKAAKEYHVQWWPFYVLIDREGIVRAAGLTPNHTEDAIKALIAEQPAPDSQG